jgi:hypothetical protein
MIGRKKLEMFKSNEFKFSSLRVELKKGVDVKNVNKVCDPDGGSREMEPVIKDSRRSAAGRGTVSKLEDDNALAPIKTNTMCGLCNAHGNVEPTVDRAKKNTTDAVPSSGLVVRSPLDKGTPVVIGRRKEESEKNILIECVKNMVTHANGPLSIRFSSSEVIQLVVPTLQMFNS